MDAPIVLLDDDADIRQVVSAALSPLGHPLTEFACAEDLMAWLGNHTPELLVLDRELPTLGGIQVLEQLRGSGARFPIIMLTGAEHESADAAFRAGADDFVRKPFEHDELRTRCRRLLEAHRRLRRLEERQADLETVVEMTQRMASGRDVRDTLRIMVVSAGKMTGADRVSVVLANKPSDQAYVLTSSDDLELRDRPIRLSSYPELRRCLELTKTLNITDSHVSSYLEDVNGRPELPFRASCMLPIADEHSAFGILFVRFRQPNALAPSHIPLLETLGRAASTAIRNARLLQSLKLESRQRVEALKLAHRRMEVLQPYAEFFRHSADGMAVLEATGEVLYANPMARQIAGLSNSPLREGNIRDYVDPSEHHRVREVLEGFQQGRYPKRQDFQVRVGQALRIFNVSFSSALGTSGAALLTFRDVTRERETERQLTQARQSFERVIDNSLDAIVSANSQGTVLVFNRAAGQIFGYDPQRVIQKMSVEQLYPPGGAREVMRLIRNPDEGGKDQLREYQVEMLDSAGKTVPVRLSAALIYDQGRRVGSVGIFADIRSELRMQARLRETQEELRIQEKSVAVAQLAGATAHELNQPLTSVIAYAELLTKKLSPEDPLAEKARVIMDQAQRMAGIVRQIGKITRYETKAYVGGSHIIDLNKATEDA